MIGLRNLSRALSSSSPSPSSSSSSTTFKALVSKAKNARATVETLDRSQLPTASTVKASPGDCDLLVRVDYSSVNFKDAMVTTGKYPGLKFPMVGGIDLVGRVEEVRGDGEAAKRFLPGQGVVVNGFGMGTDHFGGFSELAAVKSDWCLSLDEAGGISPVSAARLGTAGYTALLLVDRFVSHLDQLERDAKVRPPGPVLVTGASGGVGSVAVALLSTLGFDVVAASGKAGLEFERNYLSTLGAKDVVARSEFESGEPKPLGKENYSACIDTAGGNVLANVLPCIGYGGAVFSCGMAAGMALNTSVAPFILRDVSLVGVDSVFVAMARRKAVYSKYAPVLENSGALAKISCNRDQEIQLDQVPEISSRMLRGQTLGRYIVRVPS